MTTITPKQAAYIEDLRSDLPPIAPTVISANIEHVLDYAVQRAYRLTKREIRASLKNNGRIEKTELRAITQEIFDDKLQRTDVRALMTERITEWATALEREYSEALNADLEKIDRAEASDIIDFLTSPWGILAINATSLPAEIVLASFPEQDFVF
ncbi:hypothetical protein [Lawsonella clevelandensis]|uniref:hypothetical protein n=1 Tax=Lawsonella clevelandensis TaxID=1528099 RepID=UPI0032D98B5F